MPVLALLWLLSCHLLTGYGILRLFRFRPGKPSLITLSLLIGIAVASFLPFLLQLLFIPITGRTVFSSLAATAVLLNIPTFMRIRKEGFSIVVRALVPARLQVRPFEVVYWLAIGFLVFVSVWRCYYYPPTSRDALSGPEAIAEFTVREHTMVNSFFNIDLQSTNNQFKSPFLVSLQVIYKLAGFPFGQVWLSIVFISLTVFLYHALCEKLHPLVAATLLLLFTMAPEPYAYTFMILYDYSNMVYFFLGLYFLFQYFSATRMSGDASRISRGSFYLAGLLLGIATYIRSETLVLVLLFLPPMLLVQRRARVPFSLMAERDLLFLLPTLAGYYLTVQLYNNHYLPVHYVVGSLVDPHLALPGLFRRYADIFSRLLTGELSIRLWGYFYYLTAALLVAEALLLRRFTRDARNWLYAMAVVYGGLGFIGWLLPVMDLADSTKRGLFKLLPLALFYLANNKLLTRLSVFIARWEVPSPNSATRASGSVAAGPKAVPTKTGKSSATAGGGYSRNMPPATAPGRSSNRSQRRKK
jgi:hypothetical protein